jgi:acyl carrier protein
VHLRADSLVADWQTSRIVVRAASLKPRGTTISSAFTEAAEAQRRRLLHAYFVDTAFPKKLPVQFRRLLEQQLGLDLGGLRPDDNLACVSEELDTSELIHQIEEDFEIIIPRESWNTIDGTFNSLLAAMQDAATRKTRSLHPSL